MEPQLELDFFDIVKDFNKTGIKYLIIGRRAVVLYGAPVLTADYDFWIDSSQKDEALSRSNQHVRAMLDSGRVTVKRFS